MTDYERQFLIMLNTGKPLLELVSSFVGTLDGSRQERPRSFCWRENVIHIRNNDSFDPGEAADEKDGFLSYPYRMEVSPISEVNPSVEQQIAIARMLLETAVSLGCAAVICADFEELL